MVSGARHRRIGVTTFDEPRKAVRTLIALLDSGFGPDQLCLVAFEPAMAQCMERAERCANTRYRLPALLSHPTQYDVSQDGVPIVATSLDVLNAAMEMQGQSVGAAMRGTHMAQRMCDLNELVRTGHVVIVASSRSAEQQQVATRVLLANSAHRVMTYETPLLH